MQRAERGIPVAVSCRALGVSQAWFFKWRTRDRSPRRKRRAALAATIAYLSANHSGTYGSPRIAADLHAMNWRVSKSTVATLMAEAGVVARRKRRRRGTATPDKSARKAPDGLRRDFTPDAAAGRALCGDLTETPTDVGKLHSRRCWICIRGAHTDTRHWMVHCVQPTLSVDPSAGHPPSVSESSGQRGGVPTADECPVWRPLRFWPMGARRVGVSVSWGVLRNTRRNLPI